MSLNKHMAAQEDGIALFNGEWYAVLKQPNHNCCINLILWELCSLLINNDGCELKFEPTDNAMPMFKKTKKGQISLTTHRIIFRSKSATDEVQSIR